MAQYAIAAFVFLIGLAFGSFLNVCIYRIPRQKSVVLPASACPQCGAAIRAYDNVPVFSWLLLGGKCRNCRARISPRYIIVEALTALLFLASYLHANSMAEAFKLCLFSFLVLGLIFIDAEHHLLPDKLTLPGLAAGLAFSLLVPVEGILPYMDRIAHPSLLWLVNSLLGAAFGALFIYAAGEIYFRMRGVHGMGFGDVKLMAMVGAYLGIKLTLLTILLASCLGTLFGVALMLAVWRKRVMRRMRSNPRPQDIYSRSWQSAQLMLRAYEVPFGVFLGSMALVSLFVGDPMIQWYMSLFR